MSAALILLAALAVAGIAVAKHEAPIMAAALALAMVSAFQLGVWWNIRKNRTYRMSLEQRLLNGLFPRTGRPRLPNCSSLVADGVPGDNPAGVSIPPTHVPPAGAHVDISNVHRGIESGHDAGLSAASEFFPQHRGR